MCSPFERKTIIDSKVDTIVQKEDEAVIKSKATKGRIAKCSDCNLGKLLQQPKLSLHSDDLKAVSRLGLLQSSLLG